MTWMHTGLGLSAQLGVLGVGWLRGGGCQVLWLRQGWVGVASFKAGVWAMCLSLHLCFGTRASGRAAT